MKSKGSITDGSEEIFFYQKGEGGYHFCITSALHGDEISSSQVNETLIKSFNLSKRKITSFPVCNPIAFKMNQRNHPKYGDLNRDPLKHPGIKKIFNKFIRQSDFYIDIHSWNIRSEAFLIIPYLQDDEESINIRDDILNFCSHLDLPVLEENPDIEDTFLRDVVVNDLGIPAVTLEVGPKRMSNDTIQNLANGLLKGMKKFDDPPNQKAEVYQKKKLTSDFIGDIKPKVQEGDTVKEGDLLCKIGSREIKSSYNGWVVAFNETLELTEDDDEICLFAKEKDD